MFENTKFRTGVDYYHRLNFIFNLLIAIPLLPFALLYLGNMKSRVPVLDIPVQWIFVIDTVTVTTTVILSYYAIRGYRESRILILVLDDLRQKMISFHESLVRTYLMLLCAASITVLGYFLTLHTIHVVIFIALLVIFSLKRPSLKMIVEELKLVGEESDILRNRSIIV